MGPFGRDLLTAPSPVPAGVVPNGEIGNGSDAGALVEPVVGMN
jgi:hypothetical protein